MEIASDSPHPGSANLSQAVLLDHFRHPRNRRALGPPALEGVAHNPYCGDVVQIWVHLEDGVLEEVTFDGQGCTISQAAASIVSEVVRGKTPQEAKLLRETFVAALSDGDVEPTDILGDLRSLKGAGRFPARVRCALLAFEALQTALDK